MVFRFVRACEIGSSRWWTSDGISIGTPSCSRKSARRHQVASLLTKSGLELRTGIAGTGIATLVEGPRDPGRTILFRADMDALPIHEENTTDYVSKNAGVMHACGHDGHTSILAHTVLETLALRDTRALHSRFVFQPAEEGPGGALPMIREGVLQDPPVEAAFGLHLWNKLEAGKVAVTSGPFMAAADEFHITIHGLGGHGAYPHDAIDAVVIGSYLVTALQTLVSRDTNPVKTAVVSVGTFHAGSNFNIIAETARLKGTVRTFDLEVRARIIERLQTIVEHTAKMFRAKIDFEFLDTYPPTVNDPEMAEFVAEVAAEVVGQENVVRDLVSMGGEDMSFFLQEVPGCYFFLGSADPSRKLDESHHSPRFDFDERVMPLGAELFLRIQERYLARFPEKLIRTGAR
ncbi:MAG: M20 family metallopeptidase [Candidatus Eisenbacteria bacterium]